MYIPRRKQKKRLDARSGQTVPMSSDVPAKAYTYNSLSKILSNISEKTLPAILSFYDKEAKIESESNLNNFKVTARERYSELLLDPTATPEDAKKIAMDLEESLDKEEWAKGYDGIYGTQAKNELAGLKTKFNFNYINNKYPKIESKSFSNITTQYDLDIDLLSIKNDGSKINFLDNKLVEDFHSSVISNLKLRVGEDNVTRDMVYKEFERPDIIARELTIEKQIKDKNFEKVKQQLNNDVDMGTVKLSTLDNLISLLDKKNIEDISPEDYKKLGAPDLAYLLKLRDVGYSTKEIQKELSKWKKAKLVTQQKAENLSIRTNNIKRGALANEGNVVQNALVNDKVTSTNPYTMSDGTKIDSLPALNTWRTKNLIPAEIKKLSKLKEVNERLKRSVVRHNVRKKIIEKFEENPNYYGPLTEANRSNVAEIVRDIVADVPGADLGNIADGTGFIINTYSRLSSGRRRRIKQMDTNADDVFKALNKAVVGKLGSGTATKNYKNRIMNLQLSIMGRFKDVQSKLTDVDNLLSTKQADEEIKKYYSHLQQDVHSFVADDIDELIKREKKPILQINDPLYRLKDSSFLKRAAHERKLIIQSAARALLEIAKRSNRSRTLRGGAANALGSYHLLEILGGNSGDLSDATRSISFKKEEKIIDENKKEISLK